VIRALVALLVLLAGTTTATARSDAQLIDAQNAIELFRNACLNSLDDEAMLAGFADKSQLRPATDATRKRFGAKEDERVWEPGRSLRTTLPTGEQTDGRYYLALRKPWHCRVGALSADPDALRRGVKQLFAVMQKNRSGPHPDLTLRVDKVVNIEDAKLWQTEWTYGKAFLVHVYTTSACTRCIPHEIGISRVGDSAGAGRR
jgi:hypothetical protein